MTSVLIETDVMAVDGQQAIVCLHRNLFIAADILMLEVIKLGYLLYI